MTEELRRDLELCPFCKSNEILSIDTGGDSKRPFENICYHCNAIGPPGETKEEADRLWNEREGEFKNSEEYAKHLLQKWKTEAIEQGRQEIFRRIEAIKDREILIYELLHGTTFQQALEKAEEE